jgi:Methylamine utilisation protein MauE
LVFSKGGICILVLVFYYLCKYTLGLIFFLSIADKLKNSEKHLNSLRNYKVLPESLMGIGLLLLIIFELLISFILFFLNINIIAAIFISIVLILFTIAVVKNIVIGNTDISCGCGGLLENSKLNYGIVTRNFSFILLVIIMYFIENNDFLFDIMFWEKLLFLVVSINLIFILMIRKELRMLLVQKKNIIKYFN